MANWQAFNEAWEQGSYPGIVPAPNAEPDATPGVQVCFAAAWLPYVLGSLFQLTQPAAWDPASAGHADAVAQAQGLMAMFSEATGCEMLRWHTASCSIQESTDNGATWTDISGWDLAAIQACLLASLTIRIDGGNLQWSIDGGTTWINVSGWPPPPTAPPGQSTTDRACSIAAYLAYTVVQGGLASAVDSYNNAHNTLQAWANASDLLVFWEPLLPVVLNAFAGLYALYTAGTIANLTAASTDPLMVQRVRCAIYGAIVADGQVTDSNYAALYTAVAAVSYPSSDAANAVESYVANLGAQGLEALQVGAPWIVGDCDGCLGITNVATFNGTDDYLSAGVMLLSPYNKQQTICAWVHNDLSTVNSAHTPWFEMTAAGVAGEYLIYLTQDFSGDTIHVQWRTANGTGTTSLHGNNVFSRGAWHHLAVVWTDASSWSTAPSIYIDGAGQPETSDGTGTYAPTDTVTTVAVQNQQGTPTNWYKGRMADLRYYKTNLSGTQISDIYTAGVTGYLPVGAPAHWYKMDEGTGSTVHDASGGQNLTFHGSGSHWGSV